MKINKDKLRREYFEQCTIKENNDFKFTLTPGQLFNWFIDSITPKARTLTQNKALHLYYTLISEQLNNAGYQHISGIGIEVRFTPEIIKNEYWRPLQIEMFQIESTVKISTFQINEIIDAFSLYFGEKGIYVEFPNWQSFMNQQDAKNYSI